MGDANPGIRLYADGALVASDASIFGDLVIAGNWWWRIGYDNLVGWAGAPSNYHFRGSLAYAAAYSYALTPTQILAHYAAGI